MGLLSRLRGILRSDSAPRPPRKSAPDSVEPLTPPNVGALVVSRNFARVSGLEAKLDELEQVFRGRDDLPGIKLLLRTLSLLCEAARRAVVENGRRVAHTFVLPSEPEFGGKDVPLTIDLWGVTNALAELELALETWRDLLEAPQGPTFDAIAEPYTRLAKQLPRGANIELIFKPVPILRYQLLLQVLPKFDVVARSLQPSLRTVFSSLPQLMAIEYPSSFEADTFLHAAIAHEIAHIALVVSDADEEIWTAERVKHGLEGDDAVDQRRLWEELASDFLAVHLVGPAYVLAFLEYSFAANLWKRPHTTKHPDLAWRVDQLQSAASTYLDGSPSAPEHDDARQLLTQWLNLLPAASATDKPAVVDGLARVVDSVDKILGHARFDPTLFHDEFSVASPEA